MKHLQLLLRLISLYLLIVGFFAVFFPAVGRMLYMFTLTDPVGARMWGGATIALSVFYYVASYDVEKHRDVLWACVTHLGIMLMLLLYDLTTKPVDMSGGISMIVLCTFLIVLLSGLLKSSNGEVLFELKKGGEKLKEPPRHLPQHVSEVHPLQRK